jgi:hypothetical protein
MVKLKISLLLAVLVFLIKNVAPPHLSIKLGPNNHRHFLEASA